MSERALITQKSTGAIIMACVLIAMSAWFGGCKVGPNYQPPTDTMPLNWSGIETQPSTAPATTQPTSMPASVPVPLATDLSEWWRQFDDPLLNDLVQRALRANLDLQQAEVRIREARASRTIAAAGLWPDLTASASAARTHAGRRSFTDSSTQLRAGFDSAWEIDIFGGIQRSVEAADASVQAAIEDQRSVLVSLLAELASDYFDLRGLQQELNIAQKNLKAQQESAELTRQRFEGGFVSRLDVVNADAQVATTSARIPSLITSIRQTMHAIGVLVGEGPGELVDVLATNSDTIMLPPLQPQVPIGLPSDLLRRRPDIRAAEATLHAATARIGVAESDLFPRFSLTGSLGVQGNTLSALTAGGSSVWSIGPSVSWPIFAGGQIRANVELQKAITTETYKRYQQTVLTAMQEVEDALVAYVQEQARRDALVQSVQSNREAVNLATQLYSVGNKDFLNVLQAQGALFSAEDALQQSQTQALTNLIALYKALGGGWNTNEQPTADAP